MRLQIWRGGGGKKKPTWNISRVVMNFEIWEVGSNWITRTIANFAIKAAREHQTQNFLKGLKRGQALKFWGAGGGGVFKQLIIDKYYSCQELMISILLERSFASPAHHTFTHITIANGPPAKGHQKLCRTQSEAHLLLNAHVWRSWGVLLVLLVYKWAKRLPTDIFCQSQNSWFHYMPRDWS